MLGDVGDPRAVRLSGGEVPLHVIVVHRRTGSLALTPLAHGRGPQLLLRTQPPRPAFTDVDAGPLELVRQKPVTERRIIGVRVDQGVDGVRVIQIPGRDGVLAPGVERLSREAEHPTGQPHREPLGGQVTDQRVRHFGSELAAK